jgi:hypothetical protein
MGQAARRLALEHTLDRNVSEVLGVYDEVLGTDVARNRAPMLPVRIPPLVGATSLPTTSKRAELGVRESPLSR